MAIARKCDRCGKLYDIYDTKDDRLKPNAIIFTSKDTDDRHWSRPVIDLCPECRDDAIEWFELFGKSINGKKKRHQYSESKMSESN